VRLRGGGSFVCRRVSLGGSAAAVLHLLVAADVLRPGSWGDNHIAVCGVELQPGGGAPGQVEDPVYCPACVRAAVRWNIRGAGW